MYVRGLINPRPTSCGMRYERSGHNGYFSW
nr:MAG TPA: hypothetical protein [Herelleviridae sp.]